MASKDQEDAVERGAKDGSALKARGSIVPRRQFADTIESAFRGVSQGAQAGAQMAQFGDPLTSFLAGAAGAIGPSPEQIAQQRTIQSAQAQMAELETTPLTRDTFPGLVDQFPELEGLPLGAINRIAPILSRQSGLEQTLMLALMREGGISQRFSLNQKIKRKRELEAILADPVKSALTDASDKGLIKEWREELAVLNQELQAAGFSKTEAGKGKGGQDEVPDIASEFDTAEDVRKRYRAGGIDRDTAKRILKDKFGM